MKRSDKFSQPDYLALDDYGKIDFFIDDINQIGVIVDTNELKKALHTEFDNSKKNAFELGLTVDDFITMISIDIACLLASMMVPVEGNKEFQNN